MGIATNPKTMSTEERIRQYHGKLALLQTYERMPDDWQEENRDEIQDLRRRVSQVRNYILHRDDPLADALAPKQKRVPNTGCGRIYYKKRY